MSIWAVLLILQTVTCTTVDSSSLSVGGVGTGVVAIIVFIIFGILICIYGRCTPQPYIFAIIGTLLPIIVGLIIWGLPKEASRVKTTAGDQAPTSWAPLLRWIFCGFTYLMAVVALLCLFLIFCAKSFEAYRVGAEPSGMIIRESADLNLLAKQDILENRKKYYDKPEVEGTGLKKSRAVAYSNNMVAPMPQMGHTGVRAEDEYGYPRKRRDMLQAPIEEERLLGPEGDIKNTGKNVLRPKKLPPVDRHLEMGIEIHTPPKRRRLNMIDPEDRTVRVDNINIQGSRRMKDSDSE